MWRDAMRRKQSDWPSRSAGNSVSLPMATPSAQRRSAALAPPPSGAGDLVGATVHAEIGEVLAGSQKGRESDQQVTLYKSVGVAVQDAVAAQLVYDAALKRGVGRKIAF